MGYTTPTQMINMILLYMAGLVQAEVLPNMTAGAGCQTINRGQQVCDASDSPIQLTDITQHLCSS